MYYGTSRLVLIQLLSFANGYLTTLSDLDIFSRLHLQSCQTVKTQSKLKSSISWYVLIPPTDQVQILYDCYYMLSTWTRSGGINYILLHSVCGVYWGDTNCVFSDLVWFEIIWFWGDGVVQLVVRQTQVLIWGSNPIRSTRKTLVFLSQNYCAGLLSVCPIPMYTHA